MYELLWRTVKFCFRPTSERASILCIVLGQWMTAKDLRDIADYFRELQKQETPDV